MNPINPSAPLQRWAFRIMGLVLILSAITITFTYNQLDNAHEKKRDQAWERLTDTQGSSDREAHKQARKEWRSMSLSSDYEWMIPLGMLTAFSGLICLYLGFAAALLRYSAGETAPVAKDTLEYTLKDLGVGVHLTKDLEGRLEQLESLKNKGLISEAEYEAQRKRILSKL